MYCNCVRPCRHHYKGARSCSRLNKTKNEGEYLIVKPCNYHCEMKNHDGKQPH